MTQFMAAAPPEAVRVMPDGRKVTAIPARAQACAAVPLQPVRKPRVAAYARVSTDQEEQKTSFEAQCDYYGSLIRNNPEWEYAGLYTDDGISATSTARREGFNRLIADALAGEDRPDHYQERQPLRPEHGGQPDHHPEAEGKRDRGYV